MVLGNITISKKKLLYCKVFILGFRRAFMVFKITICKNGAVFIPIYGALYIIL